MYYEQKSMVDRQLLLVGTSEDAFCFIKKKMKKKINRKDSLFGKYKQLYVCHEFNIIIIHYTFYYFILHQTTIIRCNRNQHVALEWCRRLRKTSALVGGTPVGQGDGDSSFKPSHCLLGYVSSDKGYETTPERKGTATDAIRRLDAATSLAVSCRRSLQLTTARGCSVGAYLVSNR